MTPAVRKLCRAKRHFFCAVTKLDPKKIASFFDFPVVSWHALRVALLSGGAAAVARKFDPKKNREFS